MSKKKPSPNVAGDPAKCPNCGTDFVDKETPTRTYKECPTCNYVPSGSVVRK